MEVEGEIEVRIRGEYSQATWSPTTSQSAFREPEPMIEEENVGT